MMNYFEVASIPSDRRLNDFKLNMIGQRGDYAVGEVERAHPGCPMYMKAAETGIVFGWARSLLAEKGSKLRTFRSLTAAGDALHEWLEVTRRAGDILTEVEHQSLVDNCQRHLLHSARALVAFVPKHHFFAELSLQSGRMGNPKLFSTWLDEGLNLRLREAAASAHIMRQEERIFHWLQLQGTLGVAPNLFGRIRNF